MLKTLGAVESAALSEMSMLKTLGAAESVVLSEMSMLKTLGARPIVIYRCCIQSKKSAASVPRLTVSFQY